MSRNQRRNVAEYCRREKQKHEVSHAKVIQEQECQLQKWPKRNEELKTKIMQSSLCISVGRNRSRAPSCRNRAPSRGDQRRARETQARSSANPSPLREQKVASTMAEANEEEL